MYIAVRVDEENMITKVYPKAYKTLEKAQRACEKMNNCNRHGLLDEAIVITYDSAITHNKQEGPALKTLLGRDYRTMEWM
jgi:hypothetical protein